MGAPLIEAGGFAAYKQAIARLRSLRQNQREVNNHSREEAGFCKPQQESSNVKLTGRMNKTGQDRHKSPGHDDSPDPFPRAPSFDDNGARNFEQYVTYIEDAGSQPEGTVAKTKVRVHSETGEGDIDAVNVSDDIKDKNKKEVGGRQFVDALESQPPLSRSSHLHHTLRQVQHSRQCSSFGKVDDSFAITLLAPELGRAFDLMKLRRMGEPGCESARCILQQAPATITAIHQAVPGEMQ
jgi:hypothetical protein